MRRAILTLFRSTNFGCVSQALASVEALDASLVNFVDTARRVYYSRKVDDSATRITWNTKFPLSRPVATADEIETLLNEEYDQVFVGSDEVLKFCCHPPGDVFLQPFPTAFWLSPRVAISKVLWAASIGSVDCRMVSREVMTEAIRRLDDFTYLGVRDEWTREFIRHGSPELARRVEIVPDPTWLFWPRILFDSPMRFMRTDGVARTFHNLVAHLMRGHRVTAVRDERLKTVELARSFNIDNWDDSTVLRKCMESREAAWDYLEKVTGARGKGL